MQGSDVTTQVEVALPTLLPVRKLGRMQGGGEGPLHSNTRWRMCFSYKSFTFICFHANFSSFSFVDRQNTYSCKSDLFANTGKREEGSFVWKEDGSSDSHCLKYWTPHLCWPARDNDDPFCSVPPHFL